jgi:hypothetical protein
MSLYNVIILYFIMYFFMYAKLHCGAVWLKIGIAQHLLVKISHTKFEENPLKSIG